VAPDAARDPRSFFESREPKTHLELPGPIPLSRDKKMKKMEIATGPQEGNLAEWHPTA
jgi:hypothetical protein